MIHPVVMTKDNPLAWYLMPQFLKRLTNFSASFVLSGSDNSKQFFEECFGAGLPKMLGVALVVDEKPEMVGHILCGAEMYLGTPVGMVYQFSKDKGSENDMQGTNIALQHIVQTWAKSIGLQQVYALVSGKARARLFSWFGFDESVNLVRMKVGEVQYGRDVLEDAICGHAADDPSVAGGNGKADDEGQHQSVQRFPEGRRISVTSITPLEVKLSTVVRVRFPI
jgi:hypothetical protein